MDKIKIVENIQKICKERGTNPTVAGRESGAGETMVTNLKRKGTLPSIEKFQLLAQYLGVTTSELLGEEEKPTPTYGDGLSEEMLEVIRRYKAAPPALRAAALAVLRAAEEQGKAQGDSTIGQ